MRRKFIAVGLAIAILANPSVTMAWNETGHRIVAYIAYQQLDKATRDPRLRRAPGSSGAWVTDLWTNGGINGPDTKLNAF